jgi:hypothetical protein
VFVTAFSLNVKVRASNIVVPENCVELQNQPCSIYNQKDIEVLNTAQAEIRMVKGASLTKVSEGEYKLLRGVFVVNVKPGEKIASDNKINITTLYGSLQIKNGEAVIEVKDLVTHFTNISADLKYHPRGESSTYALPSGFSSYFAKITKTGVAETGYPRPAEIKPLLRLWSSSYKLSELSQFEVKLKDFKIMWEKATELVGPWYVDTVKREIAAQEKEEARLARIRAAIEAENKKYQDMFRKKILEFF